MISVLLRVDSALLAGVQRQNHRFDDAAFWRTPGADRHNVKIISRTKSDFR